MLVDYCDICGNIKTIGMETNKHWRSSDGTVLGFCDECLNKVNEYISSIVEDVREYTYVVPATESEEAEDGE